jgi:hypothetical protein
MGENSYKQSTRCQNAKKEVSSDSRGGSDIESVTSHRYLSSMERPHQKLNKV